MMHECIAYGKSWKKNYKYVLTNTTYLTARSNFDSPLGIFVVINNQILVSEILSGVHTVHIQHQMDVRHQLYLIGIIGLNCIL